GLGWALSRNRRAFPWRTVLAGLALQFLIALFILHTPVGLHLFQGASTVVGRLNDFAIEGAKMVFGPLADSTKLKATFQSGPIFAILISATIIVISSLSSLLYHWGVLQKVVAAMAWVMMRVMGTSGS